MLDSLLYCWQDGSMKIIKHSEFHESVSYELMFDVHGPGWGFGFPCDAAGNVDPVYVAANEARATNYAKCLAGSVKPYVQKIENHWREPAIGKCVRCGRHVSLSGFTNTCDCGADYNSAGQLLADRSQWGEETGESLADILGADSADLDEGVGY